MYAKPMKDELTHVGNYLGFWALTALATVFENHIISLIQNCERSELRSQLCKDAQNWQVFENLVLPDRSILIGQKLVENAEIEQFK